MKQLVRHQGSIPGTPQSSDDDDEVPGARHVMGDGDDMIREYEDRQQTSQLRTVSELTERNSGSEDEAGGRIIIQTIRRSGEEQSNGHQGFVPGTPPSSEDDEENPGAGGATGRRNGLNGVIEIPFPFAFRRAVW